jgi:hypothetical protein
MTASSGRLWLLAAALWLAGGCALIAQDVPYISLWYKTNVGVAQPAFRGVHLSPVADFSFLTGVTRSTPPSGTHE